MDQFLLSVLLLDYNKSVRILDNVDYLQQQKTDFNFEVIVTDNSPNAVNRPKLEILKKYRNVSLYFNNANLGYTKAYNKAIKQTAKGKYLLLQNPDILMKDPHTLQTMVDFMEKNQDVAVMGPRQINDDGNRAMNVRAFPKLYLQIARRTFLRKMPVLKELVAHDEMQHLDYSQTQEVDWLQSSCIIVRSDFWHKIGGLNENYFLFMSDPEICWRAWEQGLRVVYFADVTVTASSTRASGDGGIRTFFENWALRQHLLDSIRYRWKFWLKRNPRILLQKKKKLSSV